MDNTFITERIEQAFQINVILGVYVAKTLKVELESNTIKTLIESQKEDIPKDIIEIFISFHERSHEWEHMEKAKQLVQALKLSPMLFYYFVNKLGFHLSEEALVKYEAVNCKYANSILVGKYIEMLDTFFNETFG